MNDTKKNVLSLVLSVTGLVIVGVYASWVVFLGLFVFAWGNNLGQSPTTRQLLKGRDIGVHTGWV